MATPTALSAAAPPPNRNSGCTTSTMPVQHSAMAGARPRAPRSPSARGAAAATKMGARKVSTAVSPKGRYCTALRVGGGGGGATCARRAPVAGRQQAGPSPVEAANGAETQGAAQDKQEAPIGGRGEGEDASPQLRQWEQRCCPGPVCRSPAALHLLLRHGHSAAAPRRASMAVDMASSTRLRASTSSNTGRPSLPPSLATRLITARHAVERTCRRSPSTGGWMPHTAAQCVSSSMAGLQHRAGRRLQRRRLGAGGGAGRLALTMGRRSAALCLHTTTLCAHRPAGCEYRTGRSAPRCEGQLRGSAPWLSSGPALTATARLVIRRQTA